MTYEDEVGKRAEELAAQEWDAMGPIAREWALNAFTYEGSDQAYIFAKELYWAALMNEGISGEVEQLKQLFIDEKSDLFYSEADQEIREEQQDAADALKEEYYDARREEAREAGIRG